MGLPSQVIEPSRGGRGQPGGHAHANARHVSVNAPPAGGGIGIGIGSGIGGGGIGAGSGGRAARFFERWGAGRAAGANGEKHDGL